eukprot:TRINITY_DN2039_c0_g1_i1.p1 TRINITY_DN2039_c0_g1~~TRINITY_DN2039_c0_g1_i1.p1  ORF type:complete len:200 (-),score=59.94 TRINITY_DN2039_c0_g1_i1:35-559(-)
MGCNSSKNQDIKNEERTKVAPQLPKPSQTQPIGLEEDKEKLENKLKAVQSYTEQKLNEIDWAKDIIDRTAQNLIDISLSTLVVEPKGIHNHRDYSKLLSVGARATLLVPFSLPLASKNPNHSLSSLLSEDCDTTSATSIDFVESNSSALMSELVGMQIRDCGELVVSFPDITSN